MKIKRINHASVIFSSLFVDFVVENFDFRLAQFLQIFEVLCERTFQHAWHQIISPKL